MLPQRSPSVRRAARPRLERLEDRTAPAGLPNVRVTAPAADAGTGGQNTQSETATLALPGNVVLTVFNDSGSFVGTNRCFTGYSRSTDGGASFTDMGILPGNNDAGDPVLAYD